VLTLAGILLIPIVNAIRKRQRIVITLSIYAIKHLKAEALKTGIPYTQHVANSIEKYCRATVPVTHEPPNAYASAATHASPPYQVTSKAHQRAISRPSRGFITALSIIGVLVIAYLLWSNETRLAPMPMPMLPPVSLHTGFTPPRVREDTQNAIPFPEHGTVVITSEAERIAGFKVTTPRGDLYYYILLKNTEDDSRVVIYMNSGTTFDTFVPLGDYELYYATGRYWYGEDRLFGGNSNSVKADKIMKFLIDDDSHMILGQEVILEPRVGGNLPTRPINVNELIG
jgi:hypothetical protein